jgi:putative transposase
MLIRFNKESEYHYTTFSTYNGVHALTMFENPEHIIDHLKKLREEYNLAIYGYVVMPNHFHIIWHVPAKPGISKIMQLFKGRTAKKILCELRNQSDFNMGSITRPDGHASLWQRRFYDYNLITEHKFIEKLEYIHANPVKWGLVDDPADWPYSSYRSWHDLPGVILEVDRFEVINAH